MIQFESVSKTFRDGTTAVDDLNLSVPPGQITVIVGPAGCGKTTTLSMVNRMLEPSKGRITWDGKPVKARRKTALRRQMGYVIQNGGLFPHRTLLENIATVPELQGWDRQKTRKRAVELLGSVGVDRKLGDSYPAQLSGGQQQRVAVARALAADPAVLLMDEPFSAVDPVVRAELQEFLLNVQRDLGKTVLLTTSDIDEAMKLGDQVAILRAGGRLAQVGTPQQLLDEPADSFVEGFVGRDRGYRSLSFQPASGLALGGVQVAREAGHAGGGEPVLVVDGDARPVGWSDPARPGSLLALGATFDPESDSLRTALDAALTSPVGLAVAVAGTARRYAGVVDADMILRQVTRTRAEIAESLAVRAQEERQGAGDQEAVDPAEPTGAGMSTPGAADDPEATSVRSVPPVATADAGAAATGAGAAVATAEGDEDPDATRISGPLPEQDQWTGADGDSPWAAEERVDDPSPSPSADPTEAAAEESRPDADATDPADGSEPLEDEQRDDTSEPPHEGSHDDLGRHDDQRWPDDGGTPDSAESGTGPAEDAAPSAGPGEDAARGADTDGNQWPPAGDESFSTAYDRQLADDRGSDVSDDAAADDAPLPHSAPHDTPPTDAGPDSATPGDGWADATRAPSQDPYDTPLAPEADAPAPSDPPGHGDREHGWPR